MSNFIEKNEKNIIEKFYLPKIKENSAKIMSWLISVL